MCHYFVSLSFTRMVQPSLRMRRRQVVERAPLSVAAAATGVTSQHVGPGTAQLRAEPHVYSVFII